MRFVEHMWLWYRAVDASVTLNQRLTVLEQPHRMGFASASIFLLIVQLSMHVAAPLCSDSPAQLLRYKLATFPAAAAVFVWMSKMILEVQQEPSSSVRDRYDVRSTLR